MNSIETENETLRRDNARIIALNVRINETIGRVVEQRDTLSAENGMLRDRIDATEAACAELRRENAALRAASGHEMRSMDVRP